MEVIRLDTDLYIWYALYAI